MKSKVKLTKKFLQSLGLDIDPAELPEDVCVKRTSIHTSLAADPGAEVEGEGRYSTGAISTIDVDADGDVVLPSALDVKRYVKNPVVLFNHSLNMPIGYAEDLSVHEDRVTAKTRYGTTPEAIKVYQLVKDKVLRTHSIGMLPLEAAYKGSDAFNALLQDLKARFPDRFTEEAAQKVDRIVTKALLVEYSIVTIPANEDAVMSEVKAAKADKVERKTPSEPAAGQADNAPELKSPSEANPVEIKVIKRACPIKLKSTAAAREAKRLRAIYERCWGV